MATEEVEDGRRVWCPCPLPRERMEDPPPRHRRHCHWSSVTSQQTLLTSPQYWGDDDPVSAVLCCSLILSAENSPSWRHVVYDPSLKLFAASPTQLLQESSHAAVLQECKCRVLRMQHEKLDLPRIYIHSLHSHQLTKYFSLESNTKIRIPHASLNLIYLWPNGIRADM